MIPTGRITKGQNKACTPISWARAPGDEPDTAARV